jgi:hypothetical protein
MRNLADPGIVRGVEAAARVAGVNPIVKAALHAYVEAVRHPDSLIRVTVERDLDTILVLEYLRNMDGRPDAVDLPRPAAIDWEKTSRRVANRASNLLLLLEFKNGSAIEVRGK